MRLFCFHHAGGGRTTFHAWNRALGPAVEVLPVEVSNRERFATLHQLVEAVDTELRSELDRPHVFFGHSFGALVAYRLACLRATEGLRLPHALLLSSYAPPHLPPPLPMVDHLDDHQLATVLSDLGGLPPELSEWPALCDRAIAATRIDLRLCMTDDDAQREVLSCPIHAFGGSDDPLVSEDDLDEWRWRTCEEFSVRIFRGGHFYLNDGPRVFAVLKPLLSTLTVGGARC